jgi:mono/diheme cytochrome c family protein
LSNPHGGTPERGNLVAFTIITFIAVLGVYVASMKAYSHGVEVGRLQRITDPPKVHTEDEPAKVYDVGQLRKTSPELVALGAKVFAANCASCHGDTGHGDGAAAARLTVKPRNFTTAPVSEYKNGPSPLQIYKTLNEGVGGNMPSFPILNPEQKLAAAHFVREWMPVKPEDPQDLIDAIPPPAMAASGPITVADMGPRVSIDFALASYIQPDERPIHAPKNVDPESAKTLGGRLFLSHCASCHGAEGQGGIPYDTINQVPKVRLRAKSLAQGDGKWTKDEQEFISIVTKGMPGRLKPGIAIFTEAEMDALYQHTVSLARGKETADVTK